MIYRQISDLSYTELLKAIEQYHALDFKFSSIADADNLLRKIIKHFPTQSLVWKEPIIYRARKHKDERLFQNTKELIYPPSEVTPDGRLNKSGESLFYGASNKDTALMEIRPKIGDEITVLESELISSTPPKYMEVGVRELMVDQGHSPAFIKQNKEFIKKVLGSNNNKKRYELVNTFLIKELTKVIKEDSLHNYKGTIAIGQFFINSSLADGMLYPSMHRSGAECVAIKPESYHQHYQPYRCFKLKVINIDENGIPWVKYTDHSDDIDEDGNITWA